MTNSTISYSSWFSLFCTHGTNGLTFSRYELFMLDFCYFMNLSVALQTFLYPASSFWFKERSSLIFYPFLKSFFILFLIIFYPFWLLQRFFFFIFRGAFRPTILPIEPLTMCCVQLLPQPLQFFCIFFSFLTLGH